MARCQRDVMYRARIFISYMTRCTYKSPNTLHLRMPAVLKRCCLRIRCRGCRSSSLFAVERHMYSSEITMPKDLTSPRLTFVSRHCTYCHIQPTNPEARIHSQDRNPFASVTSAIS
ncbi:hypothetical protein ARMSODRAFT_737027 [Armillaria solidipes]|uniref:Uncharacterized protein n=1 Tax=Armillaria solidipes TaxID=1076256 RepID=A0A2H3B8A0_9AGAR|nr:hypothetical protein ARMSODRAFT_737027 [Armillaria solidipes]